MSMKRKLHLTITISLLIACGLVLATTGSANNAAKVVTFNKDVAPIFFQKCAECHHPGEAAPFSVLTYKDVRPWAKSIREKVVNKEMPPWHADPHIGQFSNDRRLTVKEIETISAWVEGDAKEGLAKDLPQAPKYVEGWAIGKPDAVFTIPEEYTVEASGPDEYQYYDVPTNFKEDKYIELAEARPGNRKVVHHIIAFIVPPGTPNMSALPKEMRDKALEAQLKNSPFYRDGFLMRIKADQPVINDGCGTPNQRGGGNENMLTGYAPGHNADIWGNGMGKRLPAGSIIRFQIHYSKVAGETVKDRSSIGLVFSKEPPKTLVQTRSVGNILFQIPPGAESHQVTGCMTVRSDTMLYALMPHMHLRGKAMEYKVFYPDGKSEVVLNVPSYSFSWQTNYVLKEPKLLPKGTRIMVTGVFDNSAKNKYNPDPTKTVRYGEPTYDEMMLGFMDYSIVTPAVAKIDPQILNSYVGRYDAGMGMSVTVTLEGNRLFGQVANQAKMELLPASETKFFVRGSEIEVNFVKVQTGEVTEAVVDAGGRTIRGKKIKDVATGSSGN